MKALLLMALSAANNQAPDAYRHLGEVWRDIPAVEDRTVPGGWSERSRAERWKVYAGWKSLSESLQQLGEAFERNCNEFDQKQFREIQSKIAEHAKEFETSCLDIAQTSASICRFEEIRVQEGQQALGALRQVVAICNQNNETPLAGWQGGLRLSSSAAFESFSRNSVSDTSTPTRMGLDARLAKKSRSWGLRVYSQDEFVFASGLRWNQLKASLVPGYYWGSGSGFEIETDYSMIAERPFSDRSLIGDYTKWNAGFRAFGSEGKSWEFGYRFGSKVFSAGEYDETLQSAVFEFKKRLRVSGSWVRMGETALIPGYVAWAMDLMFDWDRIHTEIGVEERRLSSDNTELFPRLLLSYKVNGARGWAWEQNLGNFSYDTELYLSVRPEESLLSATYSGLRTGSRWTLKNGRLVWPWRAEAFWISLGSGSAQIAGAATNLRDTGYELSTSPGYELSKVFRMGVDLRFRNSFVDLSNFDSDAWIGEAGSKVLSAGIKLEAQW